LVEPAWARGQEDEADACGFDLAEAAGYSPLDAAGDVFDQLRADDQARQALVSQLQDQIQQSVAAADTVANRNSLQQGSATAFVTGFAKNLSTGLKDRLLSTTEGFLSAQHRSPDDRRKGISDYAQAAYPQQKLANLKTTWLTGVRSAAEFTNAKTAVAALQTAQKARYEGRLADAQTAIRQALATSYGNLPLFINESARIYRDQKDLRNAEVQFTKADAAADQTFDGFRDHVLMCMGQANYARALQVIDIYAKRAGTDKDFLPQLVRIRFKQGQNDEAVKLLQRCVAYQEPDLRQACAMSAFGPDDAEWDKLPDSTRADITRASGQATTKLSVEGFGDLLKGLTN
ncbi:MAG: hypothetical protein JWM33_3550, partial [Caulobacteraceae bacterium]|nr:hypothetical protein [Caulobacteraceae bacterium]